MRDILYKKRESLKHRRKVISITEHSEDGQCRTAVRKSFIYIVTHADDVSKATGKPEVFIRKVIDNKRLEEKFCFRVKGCFYMTRDRFILKVEFCHTLHIDIVWKNKVFSPKKSVTLT
jgi:hypothetical protein